jgi:hypothetical protein
MQNISAESAGTLWQYLPVSENLPARRQVSVSSCHNVRFDAVVRFLLINFDV